MALAYMSSYLGTVTPDYNYNLKTALNKNPQREIVEDGGFNQIMRLGDDDSDEVISFSSNPVFYLRIGWDMLTAADSGTVFDWYYDASKANGMRRSFLWTHVDSKVYTVKFASTLPRGIRTPQTYSFNNVLLKVLGNAP